MEATAGLKPTDALILLVTIETFLFTALTIFLSFGDVKTRVPDLPISVEKLGYCAAGLVAFVALGAVTAWAAVFTSPWPGSFTTGMEAAAALAGIAAQPVLAWAIARGLR